MSFCRWILKRGGLQNGSLIRGATIGSWTFWPLQNGCLYRGVWLLQEPCHFVSITFPGAQPFCRMFLLPHILCLQQGGSNPIESISTGMLKIISLHFVAISVCCKPNCCCSMQMLMWRCMDLASGFLAGFAGFAKPCGQIFLQVEWKPWSSGRSTQI